MTRPPLWRRHAFTRVDLAVVVFASLIVVGLLQASAMKARGLAAVEECKSNLQNIGDAVHNYASGHQEKFPPMLDYGAYGTNPGWMPFWYSLYPDLEQQPLYVRAFGSDGWAKDNHKTLLAVLQCPSDPSSANGLCTSGAKNWAGTSYAPVAPLFAGVNSFNPTKGVFITQSKCTELSLRSTKGNANQAGLVERFTSFPKYGWSNATLYPMSVSNWGMNPYGSAYGAWGLFPPQTGMSANNAHPYYPNSAHSVCHVMMMDGALRSITSNVDAKVWRTVCDPDSADVLPRDWDR